MSNDIEVEDFLAHYGVKGMKWGVVKSKVSSGLESVRNAPGNLKNRYDNLTPEQKHNLQIAGGVALVVGTAVAAGVLIAHGNTKTSAALAKRSVDIGKQVVDEVFNGVNLSEFNRSVDAMTMDEVDAQAARYWTSTEGKAVAKNINLDVSQYSSKEPRTPSEVRSALNDPEHVWRL